MATRKDTLTSCIETELRNIELALWDGDQKASVISFEAEAPDNPRFLQFFGDQPGRIAAELFGVRDSKSNVKALRKLDWTAPGEHHFLAWPPPPEGVWTKRVLPVRAPEIAEAVCVVFDLGEWFKFTVD